MGKVGGGRNFGFGKQMIWAGRQALGERYGEGHFATAAAHADRWNRFSEWTKAESGIRDARDVSIETVTAYAEALAERIREGSMSVAYAQNLLSTVNVVLETLRGDRRIRVAPAAAVGDRTHVCAVAPSGLDRDSVRQCAKALHGNGEVRIAAVVELARELGLRLREASMLDARGALHQATTHGAVNITTGTKGGRGNRVDRWVPASEQAVAALRQAALAQGPGRNLIPPETSWKQWNNRVHHVWANAREQHGLAKLHDLRAAYACERYAAITGSPAPVVAGHREAGKGMDREARAIIAAELGHSRADVVAAYIGSAR